MKIAVPYENGQVFQHFGHSAQFKIYTVEDKAITDSKVVPTLGQGHGALSGFLTAQGVNVLICGGIGAGAQNALRASGIVHFGGVTGDADAAVESYLAGTLRFNPLACCNHHGHDHSCGGHSCHES